MIAMAPSATPTYPVFLQGKAVTLLFRQHGYAGPEAGNIDAGDAEGASVGTGSFPIVARWVSICLPPWPRGDLQRRAQLVILLCVTFTNSR